MNIAPPRPLVALLALSASLPLVLLPACARSGDQSRASGADAESIGSLRNARVAYPMAAKEAELTFFVSEISDEEKTALASAAPNVRLVVGLSREEALARATEANAIDGRYATPAFVEKATNLVWIMVGSAGVDRYIGMEALKQRPEIVLTNMRAVHGPAIADHVFGLLLTMTRDLRRYWALQDKHEWLRGDTGETAIALKGRTMLVVGLGGIGTEVARRARGFEMRVNATRRSAGGEVPPFVDRVETSDKLLSMLPEADVVVLCVPLTPETEGLFDSHAFAAMKQGSYLINIARGRVVDTDALIQALSSGKLAGAGLDVTDPEPLPADHPLWSAPNVLITPHVAADAAITGERRWVVMRENVRRFGAGEPLLNVVDLKAGY